MSQSAEDKKWWKRTVEQEVEELSELRADDIKALALWMEKQPHLPKISDELLACFLAASGYSMEGAKRAIEINYTMRTRYPRIFANRDMANEEMSSMRRYYQMGILPRKKGRPAVVIYGFREMDPSDYDLEVVLRGSYMVQDLSNLLLGPVPEGYVYLIDMKHWTLGHLIRSPLTVCAASLKYFQEGSCCKINEIHFMNSGPILEKFLQMIRPFISQEVWNVIKLHEKAGGLESTLEPEEIPSDYGGKAASLDQLTDATLKTIEEHQKWFKTEETLRVREEARPPGSKSPLEDMGLQGSFRKLDID